MLSAVPVVVVAVTVVVGGAQDSLPSESVFTPVWYGTVHRQVYNTRIEFGKNRLLNSNVYACLSTQLWMCCILDANDYDELLLSRLTK